MNIEEHFGLAEKAAKVYRRKTLGLTNLEYDDLYQVAVMGLLQAFKSFNPTKGIKFEAFANNRIYGAIKDYLRGFDLYSRSEAQKIKHGEQIRTRSVIDISIIHDVYSSDNNDGLERCVLNSEMHDKLMQAISTLPDKRMKILLIEKYFNDKNISEVKIGLSQGRCSQLYNQALAILRTKSTLQNLM